MLAATTLQGNVQLTVIDTAPPRAPPNDVQPEDLFLVARGTRLVQQNNPQSVGPSTDSPAVVRSGIWARGDILLNVGDDVEAPVLTEIVAGGTITIFGDYLNADPGAGTTMNFGGRVGGVFNLSSPPLSTIRTWIFGHTDPDVFNFLETFLGAPTRVYGSQSQTTGTADGNDFFQAFRIQTMNVAAGHTLTFDGQANTDDYWVITTGTDGPERNYVVNVLDTGVGGDDDLVIQGADDSDDIFLLRRIVSIANETSTNPAFVILLHGELEPLRDAIVGNETSTNMQRVNYDAGIDGFLQLQMFGGDDYFASDDTSAEALVFGDAGIDTFQIGQLFGSARDSTAISPASDVFSPPAVQTTRGWLSRGNSEAMVLSGGNGDDVFTVYNAQARLSMLGDGGNDLFTVRSFPTFAPGETYIVKAPIVAAGGSDFDGVVVLGTERADDLVLEGQLVEGFDAMRIVGAGNEIRAIFDELLEVDGMEGDDELFVQSTVASMSTRVIGGLGSDTVNVTGDVIEDLVPAITFPVVPHVLTAIAGPLTVIGGPTVARPLVPALKRPGELDAAFGPVPPQPPENQQIDVLNIYDDGRTTNGFGFLSSTSLTWVGSTITFGVPATGLSEFERLNLLLGSSFDTIGITGTLVNVDGRVTLTVVHGGGNTPAPGLPSGDSIVVTGGGGPTTQLVLFGDTSQDAAWYAGGTTGINAGPKPFTDPTGGDPDDNRFIFPVGVPFTTPGNDIIDAESLFDSALPGSLPSLGIVAYGGSANDTIIGTQAADLLLGGSGIDFVAGGRGPDWIWGDSGINVNVITLEPFQRGVVTVNTSANLSADLLVAATDILLGEGGGNEDGAFGDFDDIIIGDHGQIFPATAPDLVFTEQPDNGQRDLIDGGPGNNIMLGGAGDDSITAEDGDDVALGDHGEVDATFIPGTTTVTTNTTDPGTGDDDFIDVGDGDNVVLGGDAVR